MQKIAQNRNLAIPLLLIPALFSVDSSAWAGSIPVINPSFEAEVLADGDISHVITGWVTTSGGGDGVFNPTTSHYPGGTVPDGENVAYVNSPGNWVHQTLTAVLEPEISYNLKVEVGNRLDIGFAGYMVQLRAGGVVLAQDSSFAAPAPGEFATATLTYESTSDDPQLGEALEIWLLAPGVQANFDDVRVDTAIVPVELMSFTVNDR
jgi:hypothetical protein